MKRNFLVILCTICALCLVFQACEDEETQARVGVCLKNPTNEWRKALKTHAERNLNKYGLTYRINQPTATINQNKMIESMFVAGCKVMIIVPDEATKEALIPVQNAGIPVIFAEAAIEGTDYDALIEINNETIGASAAEFFNKQESINKIALFKVKQDEAMSSARIAGVKAALKDELKDKWIEIELDTYDKSSGKTGVGILNNAEYADVDAIYAQDDEIALGVMEALGAEEDVKIKAVVGCGGSKDYFDVIKKSETINLATTFYSPEVFMEKSVEVANNILNGIQPESKIIPLPSELIDRDNVESFKPPY